MTDLKEEPQPNATTIGHLQQEPISFNIQHLNNFNSTTTTSDHLHHRPSTPSTPCGFKVPSAMQPQSSIPQRPMTFMKMVANENPSYTTLKRMRDYMKEMNQRWNEILHDEEVLEGGKEQEQEDAATEDANELKSNCETDSVSVETTSWGLIIHFKCPCSKSYQLLLSGDSCYYKLL